MQIVICEDLQEERDALRAYIASYSRKEMLNYDIEEYVNAERLLAEVKSGKVCPDILFMDIYMDGITGMEAVKRLLSEGFSGAVIFTTTSESHAVESYQIMADGYLLKPYTEECFYRNFKRALARCAKRFKTVSFPRDRLEFRVYLKDLEYVEAAERSSLLHAKGEAISTTKPLSDFAAELLGEACFLRCHRGCIVNLNYVAQVEKDHLVMKDGAKAPLTLKERPSVKKAVFDYFFLKMREE